MYSIKHKPILYVLIVCLLLVLSSPPAPLQAASSANPQKNAIRINGILTQPNHILRMTAPLLPQHEYWYDSTAGLLGVVGRGGAWKVVSDVSQGRLERNASAGDTGILCNGRELPRQELLRLERALGTRLEPGYYRMWDDKTGTLFLQQRGSDHVFTLADGAIYRSVAEGKFGAQQLRYLAARRALKKESPATTYSYQKKAVEAAPQPTPEPIQEVETEAVAKSEAAADKKSSPLLDIRQLPRPIPNWTSRYLLPHSVLFTGTEAETLGSVFDRLKNSMRRAKMYSWSAYAIHDDGFALVTQMEAIDSHGKPIPEPDRWAAILEENEPMSIADYFTTLFQSKPGRYRIILFAITHRNLETRPDQATSEGLQRLLHEGASSLPAVLRQKEILPLTQCVAYVYEFERSREQVRQLATSGLQVIDHLAAGGYWERSILQ